MDGALADRSEQPGASLARGASGLASGTGRDGAMRERSGAGESSLMVELSGVASNIGHEEVGRYVGE